MYLLDAWADECWWNKSAWLHDWGWDALLDQGFWEKLLQGLGGAWGAWALVHGLDRGCSWEPPPPPLWKCEERREERELVPQPDMPGRIKKLIPCHFLILYKKKWPTKHFQTGLLCTKTKPHQKSESIAHLNGLRLRWERRIGWISCTCLLLVPLC